MAEENKKQQKQKRAREEEEEKYDPFNILTSSDEEEEEKEVEIKENEKEEEKNKNYLDGPHPWMKYRMGCSMWGFDEDGEETIILFTRCQYNALHLINEYIEDLVDPETLRPFHARRFKFTDLISGEGPYRGRDEILDRMFPSWQRQDIREIIISKIHFMPPPLMHLLLEYEEAGVYVEKDYPGVWQEQKNRALLSHPPPVINPLITNKQFEMLLRQSMAETSRTNQRDVRKMYLKRLKRKWTLDERALKDKVLVFFNHKVKIGHLQNWALLNRADYDWLHTNNSIIQVPCIKFNNLIDNDRVFLSVVEVERELIHNAIDVTRVDLFVPSFIRDALKWR